MHERLRRYLHCRPTDSVHASGGTPGGDLLLQFLGRGTWETARAKLDKELRRQ